MGEFGLTSPPPIYNHKKKMENKKEVNFEMFDDSNKIENQINWCWIGATILMIVIAALFIWALFCVVAIEERNWERMFDKRVEEVKDIVYEARLIQKARMGLVELI